MSRAEISLCPFRIERQVELIFPAELVTGFAQGIVAYLCSRMPFGKVGSMSGNLLMDGNQIRELGEPIRDTDAATKVYVDGKRKCFTSQLDTAWAGTGPYTQTVVLAQVKETDTPHITPVYDEDPETTRSQMEAWQYVSFAKAQNGLIVFTCLDKQPETAIPIQIEVIS